jgi:dTDP-4-dehydrorhamnose 3,5-epimerase/CDP-3, 6-dideoxy-D-glycero-D-glycero-4-hexulose-5-epimerase
MHFQLPPADHEKMVYCPSGSVLDVVLDLRAGPSYGAMASIELTMKNRYMLYVPRGVAHGFLSLEDNSLMVYKTSSEYSPSLDAGIDFNSFGFDWGVSQPIVSQRDECHIAFKDFATPF